MGGVQVGFWGEKRNGEMSVQSMGEMGNDFCPNFLQPFLENIDRRSYNDGFRELIPVFHNPHRKTGPLLRWWLALRSTLYGCPLRPRRAGGRKKRVWINTQKAREYLEGGNQVSPKSPLLQRMKAQPLQPLFLGEAMHASYQLYS